MRSPAVDLVRAGEGLREGDSWLVAEKPKKAIPPLLRALESLKEARPDDVDAQELLRGVALRFEKACRSAGRNDILAENRMPFFVAGLRRGPMAEALIRGLALEDRRTDPEALGLYIDYLEARGKLDEPLRLRINQALSFGLHIRLNSDPKAASRLVPILDRLCRVRSALAFPHLYLGRYHYMHRKYALAREHLSRVQGRLGDGPKVLNIRARCAEKLQILDEALTLYRVSLQADRHQPHVHFRVGRILLWKYRTARLARE